MYLHFESDSASNGRPLSVSALRYLGVSISGTSTTFKVEFFGSLNNIDYFPIMGREADDPTISYKKETTSKDKIYIFDVTTYKKFQARVTEISDGYLNIESSEER